MLKYSFISELIILPVPHCCAFNCKNRNTVALRRMTGVKFHRFHISHSMPRCPTTWRSYRDHRLLCRHFSSSSVSDHLNHVDSALAAALTSSYTWSGLKSHNPCCRATRHTVCEVINRCWREGTTMRRRNRRLV